MQEPASHVACGMGKKKPSVLGVESFSLSGTGFKRRDEMSGYETVQILNIVVVTLAVLGVVIAVWSE